MFWRIILSWLLGANSAFGSFVPFDAASRLVTDRVEYSLYGSTTYRAGTNDTPFLYNGRYGVQTDTNGLLYMGARYYNPYLCRFINPDPSGFKGGLNLYAYANGNPVSYLDPFGLGALEAQNAGVNTSFSGTYSGDVYSSGDGSTLSAGDIATTVVLVAVSAVTDTELALPEELEVAGIDAAATGGGGAAADSAAIRWGPLNGPGPLNDSVANTFRGGSYTQTVLSEDTTLYRAYGGSAGPVGSYWTTTAPAGPLQSTIDSALNPAWGNTAENVSTIIAPKGTTIYQGFAAPQGGLLGGGSQVYIPKVNPNWLVQP